MANQSHRIAVRPAEIHPVAVKLCLVMNVVFFHALARSFVLTAALIPVLVRSPLALIVEQAHVLANLNPALTVAINPAPVAKRLLLN